MRNRRNLEAHNQFESGWVKTVLYYKPIDSPHCILKADVTPSQRTWFQTALWFKVEAAVRLGYTRRGCTQLSCYWNNDFVKKVKPAPVHCIQFYKKSANKKLCQQMGCVVVEVPRDAGFLSDMVPRLRTFFKRCLMPELLTRRMQYGSSCSQTHAVTDVMSDKLYCCCRMAANDSDLDDDMIRCDTAKCPNRE
ncbi:hypothetical protein LSH36_1171g00030 [Paralvinella palmiformis]|uniref:Uncharacterized protein n=1 Tax=Paralvinella palmiformis TaxID=53620 RepID=A0AAD9MR45_9ANNE|nr:hypothetical protein LSH36_1171g00030 [Paralvinella palmiformis]